MGMDVVSDVRSFSVSIMICLGAFQASNYGCLLKNVSGWKGLKDAANAANDLHF